jgi:hypothetical protein
VPLCQDVTKTDFQNGLYLVCYIFRTGKLLIDEKATTSASFMSTMSNMFKDKEAVRRLCPVLV